jgi:putative transposase
VRSGHLWQNRFYSCALDEVHLWRTLVYVERNPVRAKLVRVAWQYPWSSAAAHVRGTDPTGLLDLSGWSRAWSPEGWRAALREREDEAEVAALRLSTHRGRPLATDAFLAKLDRAPPGPSAPPVAGRPPPQTAAAREGETEQEEG